MNQTKIGGLVLAGGQARRMEGMNKALLRLGNESFLQRLINALVDFDELLLSTNDSTLANGTPFIPVPDRIPGRGPLEGICAALSVCKSAGLLVVACDLPLFSRELAQSLRTAAQGKRAIACVDRKGRLHPLCGVYMKTCQMGMEAALSRGDFRVSNVFHTEGGEMLYLEKTSFPDMVLENINTLHQYDVLSHCLITNESFSLKTRYSNST